MAVLIEIIKHNIIFWLNFYKINMSLVINFKRQDSKPVD